MRRSHVALAVLLFLVAGCTKATQPPVVPTPAPEPKPPTQSEAPAPAASVSALNDLALTRIRENFPKEAEAAVRQAMALEPNNAVAWFNLGRSLLEQRRLPEAREALAKSAALRPAPNVDVSFYQVKVEEAVGPEGKTAFRAALSKARQQFPEDPDLRALEAAANDLDGVKMSETGSLSGIDLDGDGRAETVTWTSSARTQLPNLGPLTVHWGDGRPDFALPGMQVYSVSYLPVSGRAPLLMIETLRNKHGHVGQLLALDPATKSLTKVAEETELSYDGNGMFWHLVAGRVGVERWWDGRRLVPPATGEMLRIYDQRGLDYFANALSRGLHSKLLNAEAIFQDGSVYEQCQALVPAQAALALAEADSREDLIAMNMTEGNKNPSRLVATVKEHKISSCAVQ